VNLGVQDLSWTSKPEVDSLTMRDKTTMDHNDEPLIDTKTDLLKNKDEHFIIQPDTLTQVDADEQHQLQVETSAVDNGEQAIKKPTVYAGLWAAMIPEKQENLTVETTQPAQEEPTDELTNQQQPRVDEPQGDDKMGNQPNDEATLFQENQPDDDEGTLFDGQVQVEELMKNGNDLFLVVGVEGTGKTQLLDAFDGHIQKGALSFFEKYDDGIRVDPTSPNTIKYLSIKNTLLRGNNAIFIDTAGENFSGLYPGLDKSITQKDLKIPELVAPRLRGLILVIELDAYWTDEEYSKKKQIKIVTWVLMVFRWLLNGGVYPDNTNLSLEEYINHSVNNMKGPKTRLNIPVQVFFSKADQLYGFPVPGSKHSLHPREDSPFFLAYHYLRGLHNALLDHTNYFRYDFVHSIVTESKTDTQEEEPGVKAEEPAVKEEEPCGVELSFQWLFNHQGKGFPRTEPLIEQQKRIDKLLFWRRSRWEQKSRLRA